MFFHFHQHALAIAVTTTCSVGIFISPSLYASESSHSDIALPAVIVNADAITTTAERTLDYGTKQLEKLTPFDIKDVFKKEASVAVGGSIAANQKIYVRGVEETAMVVTVDGGRQNNKVFHHNSTNLIDPSLLKSVRASAGIASADAGPGAIGGSLVFETIDVADALAPDDAFGGFLNAGFRSNSQTLTTNGALMGKVGSVELLGYANESNGKNYDDGDGQEVRFSKPALSSYLTKIAHESNSIGRFELSHEYVNDDSARPYRANMVSVQGRPVPESRNYQLTRQNTLFQYSKLKETGFWNPTLIVAESETEVMTTEIPLNNPNTTLSYTGVSGSKNAKFSNVLHTSFAEITVGFDYFDDFAKFSDANPLTGIQEKAKNVGAFFQSRQNIQKVLDISYGLRFDNQELIGIDGTKISDDGLSLNISGDWHFNEYFSINAGMATVWGGLALAENFILNSAWNYNAEFKAVESTNYSVGFKSQYNGFIFDANVFETDIENARTPTWGGGPALYSNFNIQGFDLLLGYIGSQGEITLSYADVDSKKDGQPATSYDGNYFTVPLGRLLTLNAELNAADGLVQFGLNIKSALENATIENNGHIQEAYTILNLYADYHVSDKATFRVLVDNLTDEAYTDRATYGQEFTDVVPLYEPGRSVGINLRYQF